MAKKTASFLSPDWSPEVLAVGSAILPGQFISQVARNLGASNTLAALAIPTYALGTGLYSTHSAREEGKKGRAPDRMGLPDLGIAAGRGALFSGVLAGANWAGGKTPKPRSLLASAALNGLVSLGGTVSSNLAQKQGFNEYLDRVGGHLPPLTKGSAMNSLASTPSPSRQGASFKAPSPGGGGSGSTRQRGSAQSAGMGKMLQGSLTGKNPALEPQGGGVAPISKIAPLPNPPSPNLKGGAPFKPPKPPIPTGMGKHSNFIKSFYNRGRNFVNTGGNYARSAAGQLGNTARDIGNYVAPGLGDWGSRVTRNAIDARFLTGNAPAGQYTAGISQGLSPYMNLGAQGAQGLGSSLGGMVPGRLGGIASWLGGGGFRNLAGTVGREATGLAQRMGNMAMYGPGTGYRRLLGDTFSSRSQLEGIARSVGGSVAKGGAFNMLSPYKLWASGTIPKLFHGGDLLSLNPSLKGMFESAAQGDWNGVTHSPFWGHAAQVIPQNFMAKAPSLLTGGMDSMANFSHTFADSFSPSIGLTATALGGLGSFAAKSMGGAAASRVMADRLRKGMADMTHLPEYVTGYSSGRALRGLTGASRTPTNILARTADSLQPSIMGNWNAFRDNMSSWAGQNRQPVLDMMRNQSEQFRQQGGMWNRVKAMGVDQGAALLERRATGQSSLSEFMGVPAARTRAMYEGLMSGGALKDVTQEVTNYSPWAWGQRSMLNNLGRKFQNYYSSRNLPMPTGWGQGVSSGPEAGWAAGMKELHRGWDPIQEYGALQGKSLPAAAADIWAKGGQRNAGFSDTARSTFQELENRVNPFAAKAKGAVPPLPAAPKTSSAQVWQNGGIPAMMPPPLREPEHPEAFDWKGLAPIVGTTVGGVVGFRNAAGRRGMARHADRIADWARSSPLLRGNARVQDLLGDRRTRRAAALVMPTLEGASMGSMFGYLPDMLSSAGGELEKLGGVKVSEETTGAGKTVGVFIRAPRDIADLLPSRSPQDESPAHVTFLYVGGVDLRRERAFINTVVGALKDSGASTATLTEKGTLGEAENKAHVIFVSLETKMLRLREKLKTDLIEAGFPVDDKYPVYKPHMTLSYGDKAPGLNLGGTFPVNELEIWGLPSRVVIPLVQGESSIKTSLARMEASSLQKESYNAANALLHGASRAVTAPFRMFPGLTAAGVVGGTAYGLNKTVARPTQRMARDMKAQAARHQPMFRDMETWRRGSNSITPDQANFTPGLG